MNNSSIRKLAQEALWKRLKEITGKDIDAKGYVKRVKDNLSPGVTLEMFQDDLEGGSGNELEGKFKAVHSSSALAVNSFAPFKKNPNKLVLACKTGFTKIQFEKQCPTGLGGTPPNLDLVAESEKDVIGVESKFLEYLTPKKPKFSNSYKKENLPLAEDCWLELIEELKNSAPQYLDAAQLIKHYLGLRKQYPKKSITLLYLFWEPKNWQDFEVFKQHRKEIDSFAESLKDSEVTFVSKSYLDLWNVWYKHGLFIKHVDDLQKRYGIGVKQ
jgi:hypothetical protein